MARSTTWWGFHRLEPRWAQRLVADADIAPGAVVLDVGAGTGAITAPLVAAGARVVAVEIHPGRARQLRQRFGDTIVVVQADAADLRLPRQPYDVVANPPFGVTTALLRRLLQPGSRLRTARMVLPEHAARRWAGPGAPGRARWSRSFAVELGDPMPRRAFQPAPPRDARILVIRHLDPFSRDPVARGRTERRENRAMGGRGAGGHVPATPSPTGRAIGAGSAGRGGLFLEDPAEDLAGGGLGHRVDEHDLA